MGPFGGAVLGVLVPGAAGILPRHARRGGGLDPGVPHPVRRPAARLGHDRRAPRRDTRRARRLHRLCDRLADRGGRADAHDLRRRALPAGRLERVPDAAPARDARRDRAVAPPHARDRHVRERADGRALARAADRRRCSRPCTGGSRSSSAPPSRSRWRSSRRAPRRPRRPAARARACAACHAQARLPLRVARSSATRRSRASATWSRSTRATSWGSGRSSAASCWPASALAGFVLGPPARRRRAAHRARARGVIGAVFSAACVAPLGLST